MSDERCGRWILGEVIATGALAEVRAARPIAAGDGEEVAIKRLHTHAARDPALAALFAAERALTAALPRHPRLVAALAPGDDDERPYLAMPRVDGLDLRRRLEGGPLPAARWRQAVLEIADALVHLHAHGWVHGDVNPANILLGSGGAVLCDLGVARHVGEGGPARGTPAYMAPEQVKGEAWTAAVDVFALGVVLWELASGARLFARPASYLAMAAVVETTAPPLADRALAPLAAAMLAHEPAARPDAAAVFEALRALAPP